MDKQSAINLVESIIDKQSNDIISIGEKIYNEPELGFHEFKTVDKIMDYIKDCNINTQKNISVTGFKSTLGKNKGVNICIIAELDAVPVIGENCSFHSCGHSNQSAIMCGVIKAIENSGILDNLNGTITFIGTPAEEYVDMENRKKYIDSGQIQYLSGKQDMISKGIFDDVDLVLSCHTMGGVKERKADVNASLNGFLFKKTTYIGKASHASAQPERGINAINAAVIGLSAINALRETFLDEDLIRVHGIITDGGQSANVIPEYVKLETYIRGLKIDAIKNVSKKVDRALQAGAYAVGGKVEIQTAPGYLPFHQCTELSEVVKNNLKTFIGEDNIIDGFKSTASGDIGDLSCIKPCIQFGFGGFTGNVHSSDFKVVDNEMAYIIPCKVIARTIIDLLWDNGILTKQILSKQNNKITKEQYINDWLKLSDTDMFVSP